MLRRTGFTLTILPAVIAVIAPLLSVLRPVFKSVVCTPNLSRWNIIRSFYALKITIRFRMPIGLMTGRLLHLFDN